jgi:hypothetical protein
MEPGVPANYIAWANVALRHNDVAGATAALDRMVEFGLEKNNAAYYDARARVADAAGRPEDIEPAMARAVEIEPANSLYRLRLASMQAASPRPEVREKAMAVVEELANDPVTRRPALRVLLYTAIGTRDGARVIPLAQRLRESPDALLEDRLLYLGIMRKAGRWEFWWDLGLLMADPPKDADALTDLMRWLVRNNLAAVVVAWGDRLPNERRLKAPVAIALAEAITLRSDWERLRPIVKTGDWGELNFQRQALLARVLREQGDEAGSKTQWNAAVTAAADRPEAYDTLLTLVRLWKWDDEQNALLWTIARGRSTPRPALDELLRRNLAAGKTQELQLVFARYLELDPKDAEAKNNLAYASLLLNTDPKRAQTLAAEAYKANPTHPGYAATYSIALYFAGKAADGLKIAETIPEAERKVPSTALTYALLLSATGAHAEARKYLAIAEAGSLLPQERTLAAKARQKVGR